MTNLDRFHVYLEGAIRDIQILAGDEIGSSDCSWQDVAGAAVLSLRLAAEKLDLLRKGQYSGPMTFKSPRNMLL